MRLLSFAMVMTNSSGFGNERKTCLELPFHEFQAKELVDSFWII